MDLTRREREILAAVASGPIAWRRPFAIALEVGTLPAPAILPELRDLIGRGLLESWVLPRGYEVLTLTPLAAALLELALIETGHLERPRWTKRTDPPPAVRTRPDPTMTGRPPAATLLDAPEFQFTRRSRPHRQKARAHV